MLWLENTKALRLFQWDSETMETEAATTVVTEAASAASIMNHVRKNRIEYLLALGLLHLLGVSDRLLSTINGVCF